MALVDRIPPTEVEIPHEPGCFFTFRCLTANELDAIRLKRQEEEPAQGLVLKGLLNWRGGEYDGRPCDDMAKGQLDEKTRDWAASCVLDISRFAKGEAKSSDGGSPARGAAE